MKKLLLTTTALIALGIVPAAAADLAARPYTKAPAAAVAINNWTGFYLGADGRLRQAENADNFALSGVLPVGSHDATGGTVGGQIGYPGRPALGLRRGSAGRLGGLPR